MQQHIGQSDARAKRNPSRRTLFGLPLALAGLSAAPPAALAAHPDAELIATLLTFDAMERRVLATYDGPDAIEDEDERQAFVRPIVAAQKLLMDKICALRATTMEGLLTRVRTVLFEDQDIMPDSIASTYVNERLLGSLLRDLSVLAGVAVSST